MSGSEFINDLMGRVRQEVDQVRRDRAILLVLQTFLVSRKHPKYDDIVERRNDLLRGMSDEELERFRLACSLMHKEVQDRIDVRRAAEEMIGRMGPIPRPPHYWFPGGRTYRGRGA